jgi:hypothetical protein
MPIDPFQAISALIRAEATRTTEPEPVPSPRPAAPPEPHTSGHTPRRTSPPAHHRTWRQILRSLVLPRPRRAPGKTASPSSQTP